MALKCVHKGCEKLFSDAAEECHYHPGPPIFHEGQKGWKCCKPRVLTFEEFMTIPPCTTGAHSTTDTPLPPVQTSGPGSSAPSAASILASKIDSAASSAPTRAPVLPPAAPAAATPPAAAESDSDDPSLDIPDGKTCRRRGCGAAYKKGAERGEEGCVHHPGAPIFHEGSKGYSCCKRRVLEFDQFMKIEGCETKGRHLFVGSGKRKGGGSSVGDGEEVLETVRNDFYQTASTVIASFFLKKIAKDKSTVKFKAQEVVLDLVTSDPTPKRYKADVPLFGPIDAGKSAFKILGTKLEVTLAKADGVSWPVLRSDQASSGEILQIGKAGLI